MAFLEQLYFGSTILQYLIYFAIIIGAIIFGKIIHWIIEKVVHQIAKKTKTSLDDLLVASLKRPFIFLIFVLGFHFGKFALSLPPTFSEVYGQIVYVLVVFLVAWSVSGLLDGLLTNYLTPIARKSKSELDDALIPIFRKLVKVVVFLIAIIMVLDNVGINVASLIAGLGLGGLAFALAAQDLLKNLFGGVAILSDKPFSIGQRIKIGKDIDGIVKEVGLRTTRIRTWDGTYLIIPNSQIADTIVENVSKEESRRIVTTLGVEYGTSNKKIILAKKILSDIVKKNKNTKNESQIHFISFGDFSLNIRFVYWIANKDAIFDAQHEINMEIKQQFEKVKIDFAFPSQTIYTRKG